MSNLTTDARDNEYADISLVAIIHSIRKYWYLLLSSIVVTTSAAVAIAFMAAPVYESTILITPVSSSAGGGGGLSRLLQNFGGLSGGGFGTSAGRNSRAVSLSALSSPFFTRAFLEEENLLPILFSDMWDAENKQWSVDTPEEIPTLSEGYEKFSNEVLEVIDDQETGLVTIVISWTDPFLAAEWANKLVARVNERLRSQAIEDADLTIQYLNEELAGTIAVELQQALYFLVESEIQKRTIAKVQKEYAFAVLSPAIPADADKFVWPNRPFLISAGFLAGALIGLLLIFLFSAVTFVRNELRTD